MQKPSFTIDWEPYFCYRPYSQFWEDNDPLVEEPTLYLLDLLRRHQIKATWYVLGWLADKRWDLMKLIKDNGHTIGYHSYYHVRDESDIPSDIPYRSPRWEGEKRLYSGGFWFRLFPYWVSKKLLEKSGTYFVHPYDVMLESPVKSFKRTVGLKTARDKLERLCREVEFEAPILQPTIA